MTQYDAVVVGGGIQGATMTYEIARRGLRPLLIERSSLGTATTSRSFGIIHGGLRYLQTLDFQRYRRSSLEQSWFLEELAGFVTPIDCMMPLYRGALRSPALFRAAFTVERMIRPAGRLDLNGRFIEPRRVVPAFPLVRDRLIGAACWQEALLADSTRAVAAIVQRARLEGAACLTNAEASELMVAGGRVAGIRAHGKDEATTEIHAPVVILCVGPRARSLARRFDRDHAELSSAVLAFNMLLDLPVPGAVAVAISPTPGRGRSLFFRGHDGLLLAGTWYAPWFDAVEPEVSPQLIENALADVRACMPGVECTRAVVRDIWAGVLPGESTAGSLRGRDVFLNHGVRGGAHGLYSVQGVKLTTARALSARAASQIWPFQSRQSQHGRRVQHRRST